MLLKTGVCRITGMELNTKHTFADIYLTVMFEVILSAIIDSRIILSLFYTPLQLLFKTKINSKTLRQVNSANYLIYECHQTQRLNFATCTMYKQLVGFTGHNWIIHFMYSC